MQWLLFSTLIEGDDERSGGVAGRPRGVARRAPAKPEPSRDTSVPLRLSGTYLVTGGLGRAGIAGRKLARAAGSEAADSSRTHRASAARDVAHLHGGRDERAVEIIRALEAAARACTSSEADVSSARDPGGLPRGVRPRGAARDCRCAAPGRRRQAGGAADVDEPIPMEHFAAKVAGAWNLHLYFAATPLDFFVLFSSGSALLGLPGIGAYAAANAFSTHSLRPAGRKGFQRSASTGASGSESGMAAACSEPRPIDPARARHARADQPRSARDPGTADDPRHASVAIMPFDWDEWSAAHPATAARRYLRLLTTARADVADEVSISRDEILLAPPEARAGILERYLSTRLARILNVDPATLERDQPLTQLGIDSLMAVELKNRVEADLRTSVSIVALLQGGTIAKLARVVLDTISDRTPAVPALEPSPLEALSAEEARVLLAQLDQLPAATVTAWIDSLAPADERGGPA